MARLSQLLTRIDRVLELTECWLERRTGARLEPALGIDWPRDQLHAGALRFALHRASRSGRVARHFVDDLAGRLTLERAGES